MAKRLKNLDAVFSLSSASSETHAIKDSPLEFWKEIAHVGNFRKGEQKINITEKWLDHWHRTHLKMSRAGIQIPVPIEHTKDPERRRGTVLEMARRPNKKGVPALFARIKFRDAEAAKLSQSGVSIFVPHEVPDGYGRKYEKPVQHVCITDYPVITDLEPFEPIMLSWEGDLALDFGSKKEADDAKDAPKGSDEKSDSSRSEPEPKKGGDPQSPGQGPPGQQQQQGGPQSLRDLATMLGIDPSITDEKQLVQMLAMAIQQMRGQQQQQQPQMPRPPMPPMVQPGMPRPMMPQPMQRPPIQMSREKKKTRVRAPQREARQEPQGLELEQLLHEDVLMALSNKQFKKLKKSIKKAKKGLVQKLNESSHFGDERPESEEDETWKDGAEDAFDNGCDNSEENDEMFSASNDELSNTGGAVALSGSVLGMVRDARRTKINDLFRQRYITAHTKKELEKEYVDNEAVAFSHEYDDGFDRVLKLIVENGKPVPVGRSGPQLDRAGVIALSQDDPEQGNPLMADATRRAEGKSNI